MKTIIRYTTWVVIILSICMFFITIFALVLVGTAGHNSGSSAELSLLYFILLALCLIKVRSQKKSNKIFSISAVVLLIIGITFLLYGIYENIIEKYEAVEYLIMGFPMVLLAIVLMGAIQKLKN
ncbi:MAG: hypothetical protein NT150_07405 [Bacteroidetes bacterium]|nr:hypothetical protein [Bacteroidota bacterium]